MIEIVEGRGVGSGKSYYITTRIVQQLSGGGFVYCADTFGLDLPATRALVAKRFGVVVEEDQLIEFPRGQLLNLHEVIPLGTADCPVLVVVDEAHMELNARDWNDKTKRPFFDYLTQSRHCDHDWIFSSQSAHNIDKQVARLVTFIIRMRNMANFKFPGIGKWPFRQFIVNQLDSDGKTLLEKKWITHDLGIFGCYNSKVMRGVHQKEHRELTRKKLQKTNNKKHSVMTKVIVVVIVLLLAGLWWRVSHKESKKPATQEVVPVSMSKRAAEAVLPLAERQQQKALAAYEIYAERFVSFHGGEAMLHTDSGWYQVGEMSNKGFVLAVSSRRAKLTTPSGGLAWVVADDKGLTPGATASEISDAKKWGGPPVAEPGKAHRANEDESDDRMSRAQAGLAVDEKTGEVNRRKVAGLPPLRERTAVSKTKAE